MKKLLLFVFSLFILTACQSNKDTKQGLTVENVKSTQSRTSKKTESTPSSQTKSSEKDWKTYFAQTLDTYQTVIRKANTQETPPTAQNNDEQIAFNLISDSIRFQHITPQYAYYDVNKDNIPELLVGNNGYITTIYYLNNETTPQIIKTAGVASSGGFRASLEVKEDGTILYSSGSSISPDWTASAYKIENQNLVLIKESPYQMGTGVDLHQLLGIANSKSINGDQIEWINF